MTEIEAHRECWQQDVSRMFTPTKVTFVLDGSFGSSGKAKLSSFLTRHYSLAAPLILITSNSANASHTVCHGGRKIVFKALPSGAFFHDKVAAVFIAPGASFRIADLFSEIEQSGIPRSKVWISHMASVITDEDSDFEAGRADFNGQATSCRHDGTIKFGSTCSGSGAALARKVLRRGSLAGDYPELAEFLINVPMAILEHLDAGACALYEIGQGFPLSLNYRFYPHTTSRNVTVSAALNDAMLPPLVAGNVILNFRTWPIRINSRKYIGADGTHLTWEQVKAGVPHTVIDSPSGGWYEDQHEITWEQVEAESGERIPEEVKNTTLTKLPRRIATFSKRNVAEAFAFNRTNGKTFICINFMNHVDTQVRPEYGVGLTEKARDWIVHNLGEFASLVALVGTSGDTDAYLQA